MGASTGPIVAAGLVTWVNGAVLQPETVDDQFRFAARTAVGTAIAAAGLSLVERASAELARGVAFVAVVTMLFTRYKGRRSPTENLLAWWKGS